ncbi:hypothetical protein ACOME3_005129 [Neoechinorhynchus agilis]
MEATVAKSFKALRPGELNIKRGSVIKILTGDEKPRWHWAEQNGKMGYVPRSCLRIHRRQWFKADLNREEAARLLLRKNQNGCYTHPDGSFIIRYSHAALSRYALSVKCLCGQQPVDFFIA